jgi:hypothetical protein
LFQNCELVFRTWFKKQVDFDQDKKHEPILRAAAGTPDETAEITNSQNLRDIDCDESGKKKTSNHNNNKKK